MALKAIIETPITRRVIYTTSFSAAIKKFHITHPHESAGVINIQGTVKNWYIHENKICFV